MLSRLLKHTSNYSLGSVLVTLVSVVTFPIFTRIFSVSEYGTLGLINSTILLLVGIGKFGLQNSIVRFYAEVGASRRQVELIDFFSTALLSMAVIGVVATTLCAVGSVVLPSSWWGGPGAGSILLLASPLVLIRVVDSGMLNMLRAEQRSAFYSVFTVARKYVGLVIVLGFIFFFARNLHGFYIGTILSEGLAVALMFALYQRKSMFDFRRFSWPLLTAMLAFGLPLLASELSTIVLNIGGRYIINAQLGTEPLGAYSAAYNLCDYVQAALTTSFGQAVIPMYTVLWEQRGRDATTDFLQQSLRYYIAVSTAVLAGMVAVGPELLRVLASDKYDAGSAPIPYIVAGMLISGGTPIFSAGIYVKKQTRVVMYSVMAAAAANLVLTAVLTRTSGIVGAGIANLVSFVIYASSTAYFGRNTIHIRMPWSDFVKFMILAVIMYVAVAHITFDNVALRVPVQIAAGVIVYGVLLISADRQVREMARDAVARVRKWRSERAAGIHAHPDQAMPSSSPRADAAPRAPRHAPTTARLEIPHPPSRFKTSLVRPLQRFALTSGLSVRLTEFRPQRRILMLHNVDLDRSALQLFEGQLVWLKRNFPIVSLNEVVRRHEQGVLPERNGEVVLTFDDGLRNQGEYAYRILLKHKIPATIFICPELVENRSWLWNQEARARLHTLSAAQRQQLDLPVSPAYRDVETIIAWMKTLALQTRKSIENVIQQATPGFVATPDLRAVYDPLTWDDIRAMDSRIITIGSHTMTHPILPTLEDLEMEHEIVDSRTLLEQRLNRRIEFFCYPNGSHDPRARQLVAKHYRAAVTAEGRFVRPDTPLEVLPRIPWAGSVELLAWRLLRPSA